MKHKQKKREKVLRKLLDSHPAADTATVTATATHTDTHTPHSEKQTSAPHIPRNDPSDGDTAGDSDSAAITDGILSGASAPDPIVGYWKPTLALSLVLDMPPFPRNRVPAQIAKVTISSSFLFYFLLFSPCLPIDRLAPLSSLYSQHMLFLDDGKYHPVIYHNGTYVPCYFEVSLHFVCTGISYRHFVFGRIMIAFIVFRASEFWTVSKQLLSSTPLWRR